MAADALSVARLKARGVGRALLRRLVDAGCSDRDALQAAGREKVAGVLKNKAAAASIWTAVQGRKAASKMSEPSPGDAVTAAEVEVAALEEPAEPPTLVVDLMSRRVTYRGDPIPTKPPHNLRPQSVLALAVLASRPGEIVPMDDLAGAMRKLVRSNRRLVTPESKEIRYQLLKSFRRALDGIVAKEEIESIVENIPGVGLRLNASARAHAAAPPAARAASGG